MGSDNFADIRTMYTGFGFIDGHERPPHVLDRNVMAERIAFLAEELHELEDAVAGGDLASQADALVDLVVVALGTAALADIPWRACWDEVLRANNAKERGAGRHHGHRPGADLVKPPGWRAPDLRSILVAHGYVEPDDEAACVACVEGEHGNVSQTACVACAAPADLAWLALGARVDYHAVIGGPVTDAGRVVKSVPERLSGGQWVVRLDGKPGCVAVEALTPHEVAACDACADAGIKEVG